MSIGNFVRKFVEFGEEQPRSLEGDPLTSEPSSTAIRPSVPTPASGSDFNVSDIYRQARISPAPFTAERALEILETLPKELAPQTKRQVLSDILRAKGISPEAVAEDARNKVDALTTTLERLAGQVAEFISTTEAEIANLQSQIQEKRDALEQAQVQEQQLTQMCRSEAERLKAVLEFFG